MTAMVPSLVLGMLLGTRHALEPDHLAAVSVMVTRRGRTSGAGIALGAAWGLGHSAALFAVGCVLAVIDSRLPARLADGFELLVGTMLVALGTRAVLRARTNGVGARRQDGSSSHWRLMRQPLLVGVVHGLAGSGALTALAIASLPTVATRLGYMALFGLGSVLGMTCLTGLVGWPLARLSSDGALVRWLSFSTGTLSALLGAAWAWSAIRGLVHM